MKNVDKLRILFQQIDEAKNPSEIEVLGIEVNKISVPFSVYTQPNNELFRRCGQRKPR